MARRKFKICYWCKLAGVAPSENQHSLDEVGGTDADTKMWICDFCVDAVEDELKHTTQRGGGVMELIIYLLAPILLAFLITLIREA